MKHIVNFSYGVGSWAEAKLTVEKYGKENVLLLFADTRYEDEDTYAWGEAAAANVGAELVKIADGRDIWEVFLDARFLGNTRADPCSKILKRAMCDQWVQFRYSPNQCVLHYGIDASESDRLRKIALRVAPYQAASLLNASFLTKEQLHAWALKEGMWLQQLYQLGFPHANCGGRCVKMGQKGWAHLLAVMPERYAECEAKEEEVRQHLGKDVSILRDRRDGVTRVMTLKTFRLRLQGGGECDDSGFGGCACFAGTD